MKLDKIKFAKLIHHITQFGFNGDVEDVDDLIDIDVSQPDVAYPASSDISQLMFLIQQGTQKIEAIKLHRKLTGWSLKESYDEMEKYWKNDKAWTKNEMKGKVNLLVHSLLVNSDDAKTVISFIESL